VRVSRALRNSPPRPDTSTGIGLRGGAPCLSYFFTYASTAPVTCETALHGVLHIPDLGVISGPLPDSTAGMAKAPTLWIAAWPLVVRVTQFVCLSARMRRLRASSSRATVFAVSVAYAMRNHLGESWGMLLALVSMAGSW
jgi:hypothetical protein